MVQAVAICVKPSSLLSCRRIIGILSVEQGATGDPIWPSRNGSTAPALLPTPDELLESLQALKLPIVRYLPRPLRTVEESLSDVEFGADSINEPAGRVATRLSGKMA